MSSSSENVKVVLRIRPLSPKERLGRSKHVLHVSDGTNVFAPPDKSFSFDAVFDEHTTEERLYDATVAPFIDSFLNGFNVSVLAYGQTGSGKTHTMGTGFNSAGRSGIIPRAIGELAARMKSSDDLYVSFIELYNEDIRDLLDASRKSGALKKIAIREDPSGGILLIGAHEERLSYSPTIATDVLQLLHRGSFSRTTKSTDLNATSSRSHAVFTVCLRQHQLVSKMHFVDLAGSERLKRTAVQGVQARESIAINSGLLALGNVISALSSSKQPCHVPYRDSRLTRLLQDSLGGNARTIMVACVSPSEDDLPESINTLRYAQRARHIRNTAQQNVDDAQGASLFEVIQLRRQVASLKAELLAFSKRNDAVEDIDRMTQRVLSIQDDDSNMKTECESLLVRVRAEVAAQGDLQAQLAAVRGEAAAMQARYEDQIRLLQNALLIAQRERDQAINCNEEKRKSNPSNDNNSARYEDRIKRMGRELNDARQCISQLQAKGGERELRARDHKSEKASLMAKIVSLEAQLRRTSATEGVELELCDLRLKERRSSEAASKWKRAFDFQKALLAKRTEQVTLAKGKVQTLLHVLRRGKLAGAFSKSPSLLNLVNLNSPGWAKLLDTNTIGSGRLYTKTLTTDVPMAAVDNSEEEDNLDGKDMLMAPPPASPLTRKRPSMDSNK